MTIDYPPIAQCKTPLKKLLMGHYFPDMIGVPLTELELEWQEQATTWPNGDLRLTNPVNVEKMSRPSITFSDRAHYHIIWTILI